MRKIIYITLLLAGTGHAQDIIRSESSDQSINARERAHYVIGTPRTKWPAGILYWYYNPALQPAGLATDDVVNGIKRAASRWMAMCRVNVFYMGITTAAPLLDGGSSTVDRKNVVGWGRASSTQTIVQASKWYNSNTLDFVDSDVVLNVNRAWTVNLVDAAMSSGFGFALGLSSSNVNSAVLGDDLTRDAEYDRTLRGDDAAGCADLYGAAGTADTERALNWAEATFSSVLWPSPAQSVDYNGYYSRYYSGTKSYVLTKDGSAYFIGPDNVMQYMGTVESYKAQVQKAGF